MSDKREEIAQGKINKHIYKIYMSLKVYAMNQVNEINFQTLVVKCMHELNKYNMFGFTKKEVCKQIIFLLVNDYCEDNEFKERINEDFLDELIEHVYINNYHRISPSKSSKCIIN